MVTSQVLEDFLKKKKKVLEDGLTATLDLDLFLVVNPKIRHQPREDQ